jgi:hypothetical protein
MSNKQNDTFNEQVAEYLSRRTEELKIKQSEHIQAYKQELIGKILDIPIHLVCKRFNKDDEPEVVHAVEVKDVIELIKGDTLL